MDEFDAGWQRRRARREASRRRRARKRLLERLLLTVVVVAAGSAAALAFSSGGGPPAARPPLRPAPIRVRRPRRTGFVRRIQPSREAVPILMYHVIGAPPAGAPYPGLYVTRQQFAAQIDALAAAGFHGVTLDRLLAAWHGAGRLPAHAIVVSFDNGYRSQYVRALPTLRRVDWVADENLQLHGLPPSAGGLTPRDVRGLVAAGWELDTQGWSHADLTAANPAQLHFQVAVARQRIRRLYGVPANWFCYPSGRFNPAVVAAVHAAGFVGATTVVPGWARPTDDLYELPRLRVLRGTTPARLVAQIEAARNDPAPPSSYLSAVG